MVSFSEEFQKEMAMQDLFVAYNRIKENYPEDLRSIASTALYDYLTWSTKKTPVYINGKKVLGDV